MQFIKDLAVKAAVVTMIVATMTPAYASRRRSASPSPVVHANGAISAVSSTSITVNGTTFTIDSSTKITKNDTAITAADLAVGDKVNVKGVVQNGANLATNIEVETEDDNNNEGDATATANGIVTAIGAGSLTVHRAEGDDVTVQVSTTTHIMKFGVTIGFSDINVGDRVEARGTRVDDHTIAAVAIEVETEDNSGQHEGATASGFVTSVGKSSIVVHGENNTNTTVNVDASTKISKQGTKIALTDIKVNDRVEAEGTRVDAHTILATQIEVQSASHGGH
jgi:hypothetical protein